MGRYRDDPDYLTHANTWARAAISGLGHEEAFVNQSLGLVKGEVDRVSPYHTSTGVYAVQALVAHALGDSDSRDRAVKGFVSRSQAPCADVSLSGGRSGVLIGCMMLIDAIKGTGTEGGTDTRSALTALGNGTMTGVWEEIRGLGPLAEHGALSGIGIAWGWAGLCYATLTWCEASGAALPAQLRARLLDIANVAEPVGRGLRWTMHPQRPRPVRGQEYVTSWCNGSPGLVHLWAAAYRHYHEPNFLERAEQAGWNTWEEPGIAGNICCGWAGRSYALLELYKQTGSNVWLTRARTLANRAAVSCRTQAVMHNSLYKGEVGVALLAAGLDIPEVASHPFFGREGQT